MLPETDSFVYGRCVSPWSSGRTPGGSSGGEGALLAARCSPLGIGTDIAGSIRIPAAFCGIYGLKPTAGRLSSRGTEAARPSGVDGQNGVLATAGPMGRCVDDLAHVMRCWLVAGMWAADPTVPRMPFDESEYADDRPLRVGYWLSDGFFEPAAACMRAVLEAVEAMRAAGHEVGDDWYR